MHPHWDEDRDEDENEDRDKDVYNLTKIVSADDSSLSFKFTSQLIELFCCFTSGQCD